MSVLFARSRLAQIRLSRSPDRNIIDESMSRLQRIDNEQSSSLPTVGLAVQDNEAGIEVVKNTADEPRTRRVEPAEQIRGGGKRRPSEDRKQNLYVLDSGIGEILGRRYPRSNFMSHLIHRAIVETRRCAFKFDTPSPDDWATI